MDGVGGRCGPKFENRAPNPSPKCVKSVVKFENNFEIGPGPKFLPLARTVNCDVLEAKKLDPNWARFGSRIGPGFGPGFVSNIGPGVGAALCPNLGPVFALAQAS